jgi:hypothetical protein
MSERRFYMNGTRQMVGEPDGSVHEADPNDPDLRAALDRQAEWISVDIDDGIPAGEMSVFDPADHIPSGYTDMGGYGQVSCSCGWDSDQDKTDWLGHLPASLADSRVAEVILEAMEAAHEADLLYGGDPALVDPSGWTKSTFPAVADRIAAKLREVGR